MDIILKEAAACMNTPAGPIWDSVCVVGAVDPDVARNLLRSDNVVPPRKPRAPHRVTGAAAAAAMAAADIADGAADDAAGGAAHTALAAAGVAAAAAVATKEIRRAMVDIWRAWPQQVTALAVTDATIIAECAVAAAHTAIAAAADCHSHAAAAAAAAADAAADAAVDAAVAAAADEKRAAAAAEAAGNAHATALRLSYDAIIALNTDLSMQCGNTARSPRKRQKTKGALPNAHQRYAHELFRAANSTALTLAALTTATRVPRPSNWRVQAEFARVWLRFRVCPRAVALLEEYGVGQTIFAQSVDLLCLSLAVRMWQATPWEQWNFVCGFDELEASVDW